MSGDGAKDEGSGFINKEDASRSIDREEDMISKDSNSGVSIGQVMGTSNRPGCLVG